MRVVGLVVVLMVKGEGRDRGELSISILYGVEVWEEGSIFRGILIY